MINKFKSSKPTKRNISRREALRLIALSAVAFLVSCIKNNRTNNIEEKTEAVSHIPSQTTTRYPDPTATTLVETDQETPTQAIQNPPVVYMTTTISAENLMSIYAALGRQASGKAAVKISSGEPGGHYFLNPDLIGQLVQEVNGTIIECNTAYNGGRSDTTSHLRTMEDHGFSAIAPVDIMDADGTINLPIVGGRHLLEVVVGSNFSEYEFVVNLAHFRGHSVAGFGGVIKNMALGIASRAGKFLIHTAGASSTSFSGGSQDEFLESMAEAAKGIADHMGANILYINVMNNLSVDCDCDSHPAIPTMGNIGILASLDPVALDQACVDLVYAAPDSRDLIQRLESRNGIHVLEYAEEIGLGSRKYELASID